MWLSAEAAGGKKPKATTPEATTPEATTKLLHPQNDIGQAARAAIQVADFQPPPSDYSAHDAQKGCSMDIRRFVFLIVKQSDY